MIATCEREKGGSRVGVLVCFFSRQEERPSAAVEQRRDALTLLTPYSSLMGVH